jgi:TatD DNase family protein
MLIDSHCHLDGVRFAADRDAVIERARAAGVKLLLAIGTGDGPPDLEVALRLAEAYPFIYATAGVHPHNAAKWTPACIPQLRSLMGHRKIVGLGEIGLDYHYDFSPREVQQSVFAEQLRIAAEARKPIAIHTREAWPDTFALLEEHWTPTGLPGIMHCFTGGPAEAERSLAMGFTISFSGIVTYPKAPEVQEAARLTPLDRILVETDAPYLAPLPYRGKRNEPAFVVETAKKIAELKNLSYAEVAAATTANFLRLFPAAAEGYTG